MFISSASAYQKPPSHYLITEDTPLANPYWDYSQNKIACEERLMREYRDQGFPVTIIRPSLTYGPSQIPLCVGSWQHPYTVIDRMKKGKKIIVPGDGTSLWTSHLEQRFRQGLAGPVGPRTGHRPRVPYHLRRSADLEPDLPRGRTRRSASSRTSSTSRPILIAAFDSGSTGQPHRRQGQQRRL